MALLSAYSTGEFIIGRYLRAKASVDARKSPLLWFLTAFVLVVSTLAAPTAGASAQVIVSRISVDTTGGNPNSPSTEASVSNDGQYVVFASAATNLIADDTNGSRDIFLRDTVAGTTTRVSVTSGGVAANGASSEPAISGDGSTIVYTSNAGNLVPADGNGVSDIFIYDRVARTTARVSVATAGDQGDKASTHATVSDNGNLVAFTSEATNLVAGDTNNVRDIFVRNVSSGTTTLVSVPISGQTLTDQSYGPSLAGDGSIVAFYSYAAELVAGDGNAHADVFVRDLTANTTSRISVTPGGGGGNGRSGRPSVSGDGNLVAFTSAATNLVSGDTNGAIDVFVRDRTAGVTTLASVSQDGASGNGASGGPALTGGSSVQASGGPSISSDGTTVTFSSAATDLVAGDTNGVIDIFSFDRATGSMARVSVSEAGVEGDLDSRAPSLSGDGAIIAFHSDATNLVSGDTNDVLDVFTAEVTNRPPALGNSTISIPESTAIGTVLSTLAGVDPDGDAVTYSITAGNTAGKFAIGATNGKLTSAGAFNYEARTQYVLTVTVSDGTLTDTGIVTVDITDVNEKPTATGFTTTVAETIAAGTTLGTVTGSDPEGDPLTFSIIAGNSKGKFSINTTTGNLFTVDLLNFETTSIHILTVGASDGSLVGQATVTINVTDVTGPGDPNPDPDPGDPDDPDDPDYNPFDDDDNSIFEDDIEWLFLSGITAGCGVRLFCPTLPVTRGQMAAFLNRALGLPEATQDYFTDDATSIFEGDINRLAQSGITAGCGGTKFCPESTVTREQMAAFLVRAFEYTDDGGGNLFTDDDTSIFESDIDKLAVAGVTLGCNPPANTNFCPKNDVTREQMAAFLRRAIE